MAPVQVVVVVLVQLGLLVYLMEQQEMVEMVLRRQSLVHL
jgi:hypothetical protein